MKLVAAAKMKRAQDAALTAREYTAELANSLDKALSAGEFNPENIKLAQSKKTTSKIGLIVIGTNRGLCGGFNTNLNKKLDLALSELKENFPEAKIEITILSRKAAEYCRRRGHAYIESYEELPEDPINWPTKDIAQSLIKKFLNNELDRAYILYSEFKSTLTQVPTLKQLLPFSFESLRSLSNTLGGENEKNNSFQKIKNIKIIFEPDPQGVADNLMPKLVRSQILNAALEVKAGEYSSRMRAMDAATRNANDLIKKLQLTANRLRQSGITSQLLDILGGAEALKEN